MRSNAVAVKIDDDGAIRPDQAARSPLKAFASIALSVTTARAREAITVTA